MEKEEKKCMVALTKEEILRQPDLLKAYYYLFGAEKIINWILDKEDPPVQESVQEVKNECVPCCDNVCVDAQ